MTGRPLGATLLLGAAVLFLTAGALAGYHPRIAGWVVILAGVVAMVGGSFYDGGGRRPSRSLSPHGPWRAYPHHLARAARLDDSSAPVSHARRIERASQPPTAGREARS